MATTAKKAKKSYPRVEKTGRIDDIIAIAKKNGVGMTTPVATEYDKLSTIAVIEKRVRRDAAITKVFGRKSIPKKLAIESVKGKLDKEQKK
jgi:hypothetical protein